MALTKFTRDMGIISKLEDEPNDVGGLSAAQLKAKFDEAGEVIKAFLNDTLLSELAADSAAGQLGAVMEGNSMTVQEALDLLAAAAVQSGNVPTGGRTGELLRKKSDALYDLEWAASFVPVTFATGDWTAGTDGSYTLVIPAETHQRSGSVFGCALRHQVDGVLQSGTWAVLATRSVYDAATGAITLTAEDAYDGAALFYG